MHFLNTKVALVVDIFGEKINLSYMIFSRLLMTTQGLTASVTIEVNSPEYHAFSMTNVDIMVQRNNNVSLASLVVKREWDTCYWS